MLESYKDIEITTSKDKLRQTKEYVELKDELIKKLGKKEIDVREMNKELNSFIEEIKKYMNNKRRRNTYKIKDKTKEYESISLKYRDSYYTRLDELDEKEKYLYVHEKMYIFLPTIDFLNSKIKEMIEKSGFENIEEYNIYSYVSIEVLGNSVFNAFIKKNGIYNKEMVKKNIEKDVVELLKRLPNYEENNSNLRINRINITMSMGRWECIENWWKNIDRNIKYKRFRDFTLFIASSEENCVKQCVEELGGIWENGKTLEEMIPQNKIINYIPIGGIENLVEIKDLMSDNDEDCKTNNCTDIARLVKYNNHMGVITEIKRFQPRTKIQSMKRLESKVSESLEIYIDIESFTERIDDKNSRQIPYLICWCDNNSNLYKRTGPNCINDFIIDLLLMKSKNNTIILYAWYGSGYDFQHIISGLKDIEGSCKVIIRNSSIIFAEIEFVELNLKIILKDPYLFLLSSLDKAAKAFKVINKDSFPHNIIKGWDDLEKILPNWVNIQRKIIEEKSDNKMGVVVRREEVINYEKENNYKTILEKAIEYCNIDVLAMKEVWQKFKILMKTNLGLEISDFMFTLSQMSMTLMEASLEKGVKLIVPNKDEYGFIKKAIYGGRVMAENGIYNEEILYADVVSLYPSAMKLLDHPYGDPIKINKIDFNKIGIYKVKLTHKENEKPDNYLKFVPRKINGKLSWSWFKEWVGNYHTYDLLIAKEEGYEIELIEGIEYKYKGKIFSKFIDKLYNLKEEHSNCNCGEKPCPIRMIAKIALNGGGYGKFVQRPIDKDVLITKRDIVAGECDKLRTDEDGKVMLGGIKVNKPKFYNLDGEKYDKMVIERDEDPTYATQLGVSILSGSRYRLYKLCRQFPDIKIIYSDTDSIYVRKSSVDEEKFRKSCNKSLGSLDNEIENSLNNTINEMVVGGPKMYAYTFKDNMDKLKIKLYCKGVPKDMLTYDHIKRMVENDEIIAYKFEILKRKIVGVNTQKIEKHVRQTIGFTGPM